MRRSHFPLSVSNTVIRLLYSRHSPVHLPPSPSFTTVGWEGRNKFNHLHAAAPANVAHSLSRAPGLGLDLPLPPFPLHHEGAVPRPTSPFVFRLDVPMPPSPPVPLPTPPQVQVPQCGPLHAGGVPMSLKMSL